MPNPFLPLNTCIADGEPHVFGNRGYLFGSHDMPTGDTYCMLDYEFWSAFVDNLSEWSCKGISYCASQDPLYGEKLKYMYAPDVVQGNDGRFISITVCPGTRAWAAMASASALPSATPRTGNTAIMAMCAIPMEPLC